MTAADVLLALVFAGAVLWVEDGRLRFRAPVGALDDTLKEAAAKSRGGLIALVRSGAVLPADRTAWSEETTHELEERAGILTFEADLAPADAEREAERLVRVAHTREFLERHAFVRRAPHAPVDTPAAEAVALFAGRVAARTDDP